VADTGRSLRFEPEWRITLFVLVMVPLMVGLGFWQIQRAKEKSALAQAWEQRRQQPPSSVTTLQGEPAEALAYRPVEFTGRFLQDEYFLLDNRTRAGRFGQEVLGIVEIAGQPLSVIVNRGWLAADPARRVLPAVPEVPGTVTLKGYVYVAPGEPYLLADEEVGSSPAAPVRWQRTGRWSTSARPSIAPMPCSGSQWPRYSRFSTCCAAATSGSCCGRQQPTRTDRGNGWTRAARTTTAWCS
jgi:cytochrome oxidase assembly protein ShyY1